MDLSECLPVRLSPEHAIKPFDCGDADLNEFLHADAKPHLAQLMAVTYRFEYGDRTAAFFSVSNDRIDRQIFPSKDQFHLFRRALPQRKRYRALPAVKIGRLGVDQQFQRHKLGSQILDWIKYSFTHNNKTGCRFITIDAYNNQHVTGFYVANGFDFLADTDEHELTRLMYFDLKRFAEAGRSAPGGQ